MRGLRPAAWVGAVGVLLAAISPALAIDATIVPRGAEWRYHDAGVDPGPGWREVGYDDRDWSRGRAQLGYGDGDEATVVRKVTDPTLDCLTTWFRHAFTVVAPDRAAGLRLRLVYDDGAIVYLNGREVVRANMGPGAAHGGLPAASSVSDSAEDLPREFRLPSSLLVPGTNLIAVEVHQSNIDSSDLSFDLELLAGDGRPQVIRGPYLQRTGPDRVVVRWRTDAATDGALRVGWSPDALTTVASSPERTSEHALEVTGLEPATRYFYAVGSSAEILAGGDDQHAFRTAPEPGTGGPVRIWAIGDSGTSDRHAADVRDAYRACAGPAPPDVWLMLGDNAYTNGTDAEYQAAVFDTYPDLLRTTALWPTLGNHDRHSADSRTQSGPYYDIFSLPRAGEAGGTASGTEAYYSFDHGNIHFICLDSDDSSRSPMGPMMRWLAADLDDTVADWIIAFWHHPPYSRGIHDSDEHGEQTGSSTQMRKFALPLLEAAGVDLVLSGHSHSYERSYLLDGHYGTSHTFRPSMALDAGDGRSDGDGAYRKPGIPTPHAGAVYVVAGSSGKVEAGSFGHPAMFLALAELGSVVIDVHGLRLDATFLDDTGIERDRFTIDKGCGRAEDLDANARVDFGDLSTLLDRWGACTPALDGCAADVDGSGRVDLADLAALLGAWGPC